MKIKEIARITPRRVTNPNTQRILELINQNPGITLRKLMHETKISASSINSTLWRLSNKDRIKWRYLDGKRRYYANNYVVPAVISSHSNGPVEILGFRCPDCSRNFDSDRALRMHKHRVHTGIIPTYNKGERKEPIYEIPGFKRTPWPQLDNSPGETPPPTATTTELETLAYKFFFETQSDSLHEFIDWIPK